MSEFRLIIEGDCLDKIETIEEKVHLTFFDPPFNQGKDYEHFNDRLHPELYWAWITRVLKKIHEHTVEGGSIFLMHREKNTLEVFNAMKRAGWVFQNLIIWRKMTTPTPAGERLSKRYQIIYFGSKGETPRVYNTLYCDTPMLSWHKTKKRDKSTRIDDIWYDIRELTSGFFAGKEPIKDRNGIKHHSQQTPLSLLVRIILMASRPNDIVFDPMAGSGTTLVAALQLNRRTIGIELDPKHVALVKRRLTRIRTADNIDGHYSSYTNTPNIDEIWGHRKQQKIEWFANTSEEST